MQEARFSELILALVKHGQIPEKEVRRWEATRWLRNDSSHPKSQSIETPGMAFKGLRATAEMINQLFEKIPVETPTTK